MKWIVLVSEKPRQITLNLLVRGSQNSIVPLPRRQFHPTPHVWSRASATLSSANQSLIPPSWRPTCEIRSMVGSHMCHPDNGFGSSRAQDGPLAQLITLTHGWRDNAPPNIAPMGPAPRLVFLLSSRYPKLRST